MERRRNPNIELWRCFCMFAVVCGHVLVNNGMIPTMNAFLWHIPGFLLITGYFGIGFTGGKLVSNGYASPFAIMVAVCGFSAFFFFFLPHRGTETQRNFISSLRVSIEKLKNRKVEKLRNISLCLCASVWLKFAIEKSINRRIEDF